MALNRQDKLPYIERNRREPFVVFVGIFVRRSQKFDDRPHCAARIEYRAAKRAFIVGRIRIAVAVAVVFVYNFRNKFYVALKVGDH